jgi:aconitate hydratase
MVAGKISKVRRSRRKHRWSSLPDQKQVFSMISENGALASMIGAGARIMESTCGFCIGNGQAPATNAVSLRTSNRNSKEGQVRRQPKCTWSLPKRRH